jgi:hypothetical protein
VRCVAAADGVCRVTVTYHERRVATGALRLAYGRADLVRKRLTAAGRRLVRSARNPVAVVVVEVPGQPARTLRVTLR